MVKRTKQFKLKVINRYLTGNLGFHRLAACHGISAALLRRWVAAYRLHGDDSLSRSRERYSVQTKLSVLQHMWDNGQSFNQAAAFFNIPSPNSVRIWAKRYSEGGCEALKRVKRSKPAMPAPTSKPDAKPAQELTREELLKRVEHLEMEVVVLKKLDALTQARKAAAPKKRK